MHFSDAQFENKRLDGKRKLKPNAVPDLLPKKLSPNFVTEEQNETYIVPDISPIKSENSLDDTLVKNEENIFEYEMLATDEPQPTVVKNETNNFECEEKSFEAEETHEVAFTLQQQQQMIQSLRERLEKAMRERCYFKNEVKKMENNLRSCFNMDQIYYLKHGNSRGHLWSDETMENAMKLYDLCGGRGYEEIKRQGLPFPSIRVIQFRRKNAK